MRLADKIALVILWFIAFWFAPAFLVDRDIYVQTRNAEQFLKGERCNWFYHGKAIYGCCSENQRAYCGTEDNYLTDDTILGWAKGNHLP